MEETFPQIRKTVKKITYFFPLPFSLPALHDKSFKFTRVQEAKSTLKIPVLDFSFPFFAIQLMIFS